ncbi:hypothetical protein [Nocardioides conyzicola]|uniref:Uncharacterized protein n=1 Tax=Nocardioides conyzicola TaxID=1651781 RepID=A0ABP8WKN0_9ACTN
MRGARASLGAATVVAVVLSGLGGAGAAVPTPTAAPAATSVSIRVLQPTIAPGGRSTIAGNLKVEGASPAGRPLVLEAQATGEHYFSRVRTATTDAQGGVRLRVRPAATTRYRWSYAGADNAHARISGVVVVKVRASPPPGHRRATSLSVRAAHPVVTAGESGVVGGTLLAKNTPLRGRYVVLLARTSPHDDWEVRQRHRTRRSGHVTFRVWPTTLTYYRLVFARTAKLESARSGVVQIGIRQSVTIAATPAQIERGDTTTITGTVTHVGSPVAGVKVDLLARAVGSDKPWSVVGTATTATDGSVSIQVSPRKSTRYRLHARPATGLPQGSSRVARVDVRAPGASDNYRAANAGTQRED